MPSCMSKTCELVVYLLLLSACLGTKALRPGMPSWGRTHALGKVLIWTPVSSMCAIIKKATRLIKNCQTCSHAYCAAEADML